MRVVITGGYGFLGWHTACRLRAMHGIDATRLGREDQADLETVVASADVVIHIAGVNRAESDEAVRQGNEDLARAVAAAIVASGRPIRVVYANSIQAELEHSPYGAGKAAAAVVLAESAARVGGSLADVLLPNLFGEHGRPHYNSFVATFCSVLAEGGSPSVMGDKEIPLLHAQAAAECLIEAMQGEQNVQIRPQAERRLVSEVLDLLVGFRDLYSRGEVPDLSEQFLVDLFNTYRSYTFPQAFPIHPQVHADDRGMLVETARSHGGTGQAFVSTTRPGLTRGDHYHLHKVERFFVVRGQAEISLRRLLTDDVVTFRIDGERPGFVDMPTMWVHNISNVGTEDLVTMFWADQLLDPENPDQYPELVALEGRP
ncbi:NAD-dependent epimerase/dehydratase family protein [Nocardioides lijunqiniae]|uniref:polysaccharide biosynthesis C-terminal domain-containing protein n=1 Tax=Nocardioides lijunqiniae TaxID=2760832 RepID=UPI001878C05C